MRAEATPRPRVGLLDVAVTVALMAVVIPPTVGLVRGASAITVIGTSLAGAALAGCVLLRRARPVAAFVAGSAATALLLVLPNLPDGPSVVFVPLSLLHFVLLYSVVAGTDLSLRPLGVAVAGLVLVAVRTALDPSVPFEWDVFALFLVASVAAATGAWAIGRFHRTRARYLAAVEQRARQAEELRDQAVRAGIARERRLIAAEMHDVVAHSLAVVIRQSDAALLVLDRDPDRARTMITAATDVGRDAVREMRDMLTVLRDESEDVPVAPPAESTADIERLVGSFVAAGLEVTTEFEGSARPVRPEVVRAAYRVVQEGLTNALKHSGGASCRVTVSYRPDDLCVQVADTGPGLAPDAGSRAGHGLAGMRERVHQLGGQLDVSSDGSGTRVTTTLPDQAR